jgi:nitrite reductase/ring-hydroxylating ferredoxin subunit
MRGAAGRVGVTGKHDATAVKGEPTVTDRSLAPGRLARWPGNWPVRPLRSEAWTGQQPTYAGATPALIEAALKRAQSRPSGNWFVLGASRDVRRGRPYGVTLAGIELVAWRDADGRLIVGPGACPHLGAPLSQAALDRGELVCRWHGLRVNGRGGGGWRALPACDDGVLAWVRLDAVDAEPPLAGPVVPARPPLSRAVHAVATMIGVCEPEDIVANRLDPWHGGWFHPYFFRSLSVLSAPAETAEAEVAESEDDRFVVSVTFRVAPGLGVPVRAEFTCPEPRTVVMRIIGGEGAGSVVETHATPLGSGPDGRPRTAVIEAVVAHSGRPGFTLARRASPALRPAIRGAAARLWRDDLAYAERRYWLRSA